MRSESIVLFTLLPFVFGCHADSRPAAATEPREPFLWRLSDSPVLEIGVVEGDDAYELHAATSSRRLPDGRIVVANTGSHELRVFDSTGHHLFTAGGRGGGPGEFRWLGRVYALSYDSILALDMAGNRVSVFDGRGNFTGTYSAEATDDPDFPFDVWLYRQYWVDGALVATRKDLVRSILDQLPVPPGEPAYRFARVNSDSHVWIRKPLPRSAQSHLWLVFDDHARFIAVIETPVRFDVHHIGPDFVLGRWRDVNDVNFIRVYSIERTRDIATRSTWAASAPLPSVTAEDDVRDNAADMIELMRSAMRNLVMAQEMYFADSMSYSENRHALEWEGPEGVSMDIVSAGSTGWAAVLTHSDTRTICGVFVGTHAPPGWIGEGEPKCR